MIQKQTNILNYVGVHINYALCGYKILAIACDFVSVIRVPTYR